MDHKIDELKQHIFELSYALDSQSAGKDFPALRRTHYNKQIWLHDSGLQDEYYQYFVSQLQKESK